MEMLRGSLVRMSALVLLSASLFGCGGGGSSHDHSYNCPSIYDDLTWTSLGSYELLNAGNDSTAWSIVDHCGWHVYDDHYGGYGDTLEIASPWEDIVLVWAFNELQIIAVQGGWRGSFLGGVQLRDYVTVLYKVHPYFQTSPTGEVHTYEPYLNTYVEVLTNPNHFIELFVVGHYF